MNPTGSDVEAVVAVIVAPVVAANWQPEARHALYLFGQSMNHFPNSFHGQALIAQKKKLHKKYKAKWGDGYKKNYTPGHIHKTATLQVLTHFVRQLHRDWWQWENDYQQQIQIR